MSRKKDTNKDVKFIDPKCTLKARVGNGGIPKALIEKAQRIISTVTLDFKPEAKRLLKKLDTAINELKARDDKTKDNTSKKPDDIVKAIMQLKANGGMFRYQLISDVAGICLQFIEEIDEYNDEAFELIIAHKNSLQAIIDNDLRGHGGTIGDELVEELQKACERYFNKHQN